MVKNDNLWLKFNQSTQCVVQLMVILVKAWLNWLIFNHGIGALLKYLTIGYQFKMAARQVLFMTPPIQNRKPRVFQAIELCANLFTNEELRKIYRFGREGINYITELVRENLQRGTNKKTALTVEQQVMIILRYFANCFFSSQFRSIVE